MTDPNEPTEEEMERLAAVGESSISRLREQHGMSRGLPYGCYLTAGHPGTIAVDWTLALINHSRRDD